MRLYPLRAPIGIFLPQMDARPLAVATAPVSPGLSALGRRWLACHPHPDGTALYLLGLDEPPMSPLDRLSAVLEHLALDADALCWVHPEVDLSRLPQWSVWRMDDHGGEFRMRTFRCHAAAERFAEAFTARAHKQTYWVEQDSSAG